jgi:SAM-dependent methyltransferase
MTEVAKVNVYDSQSVTYHQAFQVFLDHTDQKINARRWLDGLVDGLAKRRVLLDAGAGNGQVTAWFLDKFERTIAIEPNPSLQADLRRACPGAQVLPVKILDAQPQEKGDLILCSHVFYYIPQSEWLATVNRMASWLAPEGALVIVLQNQDTDCMRMLEAFLGRRFDLGALAREFKSAQGAKYQVESHLIPSQITAPDLASAYVIGEFMLNLLPIPDPPARSALEDYIAKNFAQSGGRFEFSCHQDSLLIRPRR